MGWNGKNDVIVLILSLSGFAFLAVLAGVIAPIIVDIKNGGFAGIVKIVVLVGLLSFGGYLLRCVYKKNKKAKNE